MNEQRIVLSFDMEPDIGSWTLGQRGIREGTPEILRILANHNVQATFLFTGREAQNNPDIVHAVLNAGHEIGCHTMFHETVGQAVFDMPGDNFILDCEMEHRLDLATTAVERVAGVRPISFRAPRLFGSSAMIRVLDRLGYRVDSSFPAYHHACDFRPYHPSADDWATPGTLNILEVPLFYDKDATENASSDRTRDQWPMLRLHGASAMAELCRRMMPHAKNNLGQALLCLYLHPWEFVTMPTSIETTEATIHFKPFLHHNCGRFTLNALDEFIDTMSASHIDFDTLAHSHPG
jgi:peptidoglycan/xylan/chitin deacetylase (PgdA/CDA1 family)